MNYKNTISNGLTCPGFHEGDKIVLTQGTYQGTIGVFLQLREDVNWADIAESNGSIRSHPVAWLAHDTRSQVPQTDLRIM